MSYEEESVLIIDDELEIGMLLASIIRSMGYTPVYANSFKAGEQQVQALKPMIVFLDIDLPDGSGFDLLPVIKEICADCKVIMISASDGREEREKAIRSGAYRFIGKPFSRRDVKEAVSNVTN